MLIWYFTENLLAILVNTSPVQGDRLQVVEIMDTTMIFNVLKVHLDEICNFCFFLHESTPFRATIHTQNIFEK